MKEKAYYETINVKNEVKLELLKHYTSLQTVFLLHTTSFIEIKLYTYMMI